LALQEQLKKMGTCLFVGDFINDKALLFLNGKKINETRIKVSLALPNSYFSEELRSSGDVIPGFSIEFGRYYYDSQPIISELLEINA